MIMDSCFVEAAFKESMQEKSTFSVLGVSYESCSIQKESLGSKAICLSHSPSSNKMANISTMPPQSTTSPL